MCANNSSNASSPPAEAPIPTIGNPRSRLSAPGFAGAVEDDAARLAEDGLRALSGLVVAGGSGRVAGFGAGADARFASAVRFFDGMRGY